MDILIFGTIGVFLIGLIFLAVKESAFKQGEPETLVLEPGFYEIGYKKEPLKVFFSEDEYVWYNQISENIFIVDQFEINIFRKNSKSYEIYLGIL